MEVYFFDATCRFSETKDDFDLFTAKTLKFTQLSQKLYNLIEAEEELK